MLLNRKELDILEEFTGNYSGRIYGRAVAKKLKMNQKTASTILAKLEKENILKFTQEGKNKYYFLNKFNAYIKDTLKIIEISRKIKFLERNKKEIGLFEKLEERTKGVLIIFGSYSGGRSTEKSDLDVFVIGNIKEIEDLEQLYNIKINIIKSSEDKFDKEENIIKEIMQNHIILKGAEEFINLIW
jgi:predicted nucleotidyltransferase